MTNSQPESISVVKYHDFVEDPETVIDNCNMTGESAVITRHGRFLFLVTPLEAQTAPAEIDPQNSL